MFNPDVLLLDEPLGALDKNLREQMQVEIKRIHREVGITMIYVTHDQTEAMTMSDRIAVFCNGKVEQVGTPLDVYNRPANRFVGEFIGDSNFFAGRIDASRPGSVELAGIGPCGSRDPGAAGRRRRPHDPPGAAATARRRRHRRRDNAFEMTVDDVPPPGPFPPPPRTNGAAARAYRRQRARNLDARNEGESVLGAGGCASSSFGARMRLPKNEAGRGRQQWPRASSTG